MGHDDFSGPSLGHDAPFTVDQFDDDVLSHHMHATGRTLVRDEAGVAPAIAVRNPAAEDRCDRRALIIVEALRRDQCDLDAEIIHRDTAPPGMLRDVHERRWIAE